MPMLPFLQNKRLVGSIMESVKKPEAPEELEISEELKAAAEDLMNAIHSKKVNEVAKALKAAFLILESEPHEEAGEKE
jgi:hypothetical protein